MYIWVVTFKGLSITPKIFDTEKKAYNYMVEAVSLIDTNNVIILCNKVMVE